MTKLSEGKYEVYFDMGSPGLMSKTVDAKNAKESLELAALYKKHIIEFKVKMKNFERKYRD